MRTQKHPDAEPVPLTLDAIRRALNGDGGIDYVRACEWLVGECDRLHAEWALSDAALDYTADVAAYWEEQADRLTCLLRWAESDWATIECSHGQVDVTRLEEGQGEHRMFTAPTIAEALTLARDAPPHTGETAPERRDRLQVENARLRPVAEAAAAFCHALHAKDAAEVGEALDAMKAAVKAMQAGFGEECEGGEKREG